MMHKKGEDHISREYSVANPEHFKPSNALLYVKISLILSINSINVRDSGNIANTDVLRCQDGASVFR